MRKLQLFNSLGGKKEIFKPTGDTVDMYVCGITPDGVAHLGHAFLFVSFDVFVRYLKHIGYKTKYVQNLTDIDDDVLKRSKGSGKNWREFGEEYAQVFLEDMQWLNNEQPDYYPKATDHITEMIEITKKLLKKGIAYENNGSVYFSLKRDKEYGKLSGLSRKQMFDIANERGNNPDDSNKKDPLDFILWQKSEKGEPSWDSPWGKGRPGWHIECSAMAMKYLGETIDVQSGGSDLIFPHHESSIAQSEHSTGKKFAKFWMHIGMLCYKGEKMAKSVGNLVLIRDLRAKYNANVVRIMLLSHHYREEWEYTEKEIPKAQKVEEVFKKAWKTESKQGASLSVTEYEKRFYSAMDDDLNTKKALKVLESLSKEIITSKKNVADAKAFLTTAFNILGLTISYK